MIPNNRPLRFFLSPCRLLGTFTDCKRLLSTDGELCRDRRHIDKVHPYSFELFGPAVGYLGMDRVAQETAKQFKTFGTEGIYCDPLNCLSA